jgi:hypothetical protein
LLRKVLLVCGAISSLLYIAMNVFIPLQWESYSSASQTISELSAIGAPTRSIWMLLAVPYTFLVTAFGFGVWKSARQNRALRMTAVLMIMYGALGIVWPFAPMHLRGVLASGGATLSDTIHIALASLTVVLMLVAMAFGASGLGKSFRLFSITSILILLVFGGLTFLDAPRVSQNLPTPWIGVWERVNVGVFLLWTVILASYLWRGGEPESA